MMRMPFSALRAVAISLPLVSLIQAGGQGPTLKADTYKGEVCGRLPLAFEANQGQSDPRVRFLSRGDGYSLFLTDTEAVLALSKGRAGAWHKEPSRFARSKGGATKTDVVLMQLEGAKAGVRVSGFDKLPGTANYFIGNDPAKWRSGLPTYSKVLYAGVYPGVDLVYYGKQRQLEYDFVVAPGADPKPIRLRFRGSKKLSLSKDGDLTVAATNGEISFHKPVVYQEYDGRRLTVEGHFSLLAKNVVGFVLGVFDHAKPLVIDPVLAYATYLGGNNGGDFGDFGSAIAVDAQGNTYVAGTVHSVNFPTTSGAYETTKNAELGSSAFVTKLNAAGTALVYSTLLGGTTDDAEDYGAGIAVDSSGDAYVTGAASSTDFPIYPISGAFQTANAGGANAFVTELNPDGTALLYSTYLGGDAGGCGGDYGNAIALDSSGNAYVTGHASSKNFPVTAKAYQSMNNNYCTGNAFVTKLNSSGTAEVYSTYLGGSAGHVGDYAQGIAVQGGYAYVTGLASSTNFPVFPSNATYQNFNDGQQNAFITKLSLDGTALIYSTYLGGSYADSGSAIALDSAGDAYVTGVAGSKDFPVTTGAFQPKTNAGSLGGTNAFVTELNPEGTSLVYSTYLGGNGNDSASSIAVDGLGEAYVTGITSSTSFPVTKGAFQSVNNGASSYEPNAFVTKLDALGATLLYSTYLGGSGVHGQGGDSGNGIALDGSFDAYVTGQTYSTNFPVTTGAAQTSNKGAQDESSNAFIAKLAIGGETTTALTSSNNPQLQNFSVTFTAVVTANFSDQVPTGNVVFTIDGGTGITVALDDTGKATYTTSSQSPLCAGHSINVSYSGDSNFLTSSASLTQTIVGAPASIAAVSGTPQSGTYGSFFSNLVIVIVKDACSNPVFSTSVTFAGTGATLSATQPTAQMNPGLASLQVTTGSNGEASVYAYAATSGALSVAASVTGVTTPASFTLNAAKAPLTFTASNATAIYDQPLPQLFFTITGFVNGDGTNVLSGAPVLSTTATVGSPVGTYPIIIGPGTLSAANYTFIFVNGLLTITKEPQTITWTFTPSLPNPVVYGDGPYAVTATSTCSLPVSLSVTSGHGVLNGTTLTITGTGTITITGTQTGNTNCLPVTSSTNINVGPASQTVTLSAPATTYTYPVKDPIPLTAKASSGLPVTLRVVSGPAILIGNMLKVIGAGTVIVTATQPGNADYKSATLKKPLTIDIKKGDQIITFRDLPSKAVYGETIILDATTNSGLPVRFSVLSGPGKITGNELRFTGVGTVEVAANQAGNADYDAAEEVKHTITVEKAKLTVTAKNESMVEGAKIPALTYTMTGFVDDDTQLRSTTGQPKLATSATSKSGPGKYPITITLGSLESKNYAFAFVDGKLTVEK
jgi:hypothetical protein